MSERNSPFSGDKEHRIPETQAQSTELTEEQAKEIEASDRLKNIGDFIIHQSDQGIPLVTICTRVDSHRKWLPQWQIQVMKNSGSPLSWEVQTPVLETFTKETFPEELQRNEDLMINLKKGTLRELEDAGFTGNLAEIDSTADFSKKFLQLIDQQLQDADFTDGKSIYYTARALTAKGLLDPKSRNDVIKSAQKVGEKDWIPAIVPSAVTQAMYGDEKIRQTILENGKEWATGEDSRFTKIIGGWSMMAASAHTPEERQQAYDIVMKDIDTNYITMAGNAPIAAAILANEKQRKEIYELSSKKKDTEYWEIEGGNIVAMAITSSEGEERSQVFELAKQILAEGNSHISNKFYLVAMALTAQTREEKARALSIIEIYTDTKKWDNSMSGWANIALGILGSSENERDLAVKSVAAAMESSR